MYDTPLGFTIRGMCGGMVHTATWRNGVFDCPTVLLRRAEIVVALGETFIDDDLDEVVASLDTPLAAVLTLMRAFDWVEYVDLHLPTIAAA